MNEYEIKNLVIGECKCNICGATGNLILRKGKQFKYWFCECKNGHRPGIKKIIEIDDFTEIYNPDIPNDDLDLQLVR